MKHRPFGRHLGRVLLLLSGIALAMAVAAILPGADRARHDSLPRAPWLGFPSIHARPQSPRLAYLPWIGQHRVAWPDPARTARYWAAVDAFAAAHPLDELYPRYDEPPSLEAATANVAHGCADFPDLPEVFGEGAHRRACDFWVATSLALHHAATARRQHRGDEVAGAMPRQEHEGWAREYTRLSSTVMMDFVYGPPAHPDDRVFGRFRDTRAAVWQNPLRAADLALVRDLTGQLGVLSHDDYERVELALSSAAVAWQDHWAWSGPLPAATDVFTTGLADPGNTHRWPIVSRTPHVFRWDPDHGNSAIEEMAWMAAGVRLAGRVARPRDLGHEQRQGEADGYLDHVFSFGATDHRSGRPAYTLNRETTGGAYGQNRLWIENHQPDMPSVPYLFSTWHYLSLAAMAHDGDPAVPWPALADPAHWQLVVDAGEATLHAPDGTFLVDLSPGGALGFQMRDLPAWTMPCGRWRAGAQYVEATTASGHRIYVSEIGHPAGTGILAAASPMIRLAVTRGDQATARLWADRADAALREITARPPDLATLGCKVAPWVSTNPAYHAGGMMSSLIVSALQAEGYVIGER